MELKSEGDPHATEELVQPHILRIHLEGTWIGLGAAIEWIALRGQPVLLHLYSRLEDEAAEQLVGILADLPPELAEANVRGVPENGEGLLVPVPSGIWRQTATSDENDQGQPFRLIGTDDHDEWAGQIVGLHASGFVRIEIRTHFILDNWRENERGPKPRPARRAVARAELRALIEKIVASTPDHLVPLTQTEVVDVVRACKPNAPRDLIREFFEEFRPELKTGPRGPRDPDRRLRVQKFREKMIAAQLRN